MNDAMKDNSEIPCSFCSKHDAKTRNFTCKPHECQKLTKWLFEHAKIEPIESVKVITPPILYVV